MKESDLFVFDGGYTRVVYPVTSVGKKMTQEEYLALQKKSKE